MSNACTDVKPQLLGYQLGACEPGLRDDIDQHLLGCSTCLRDFLAHKRVCEDGSAFDERPSPQLQHRLRSVVASKRRVPRKAAAVWVMAVAALALAVWGAMWVMRSPLAPLTATPVGGLVDSPTSQAASNLL